MDLEQRLKNNVDGICIDYNIMNDNNINKRKSTELDDNEHNQETNIFHKSPVFLSRRRSKKVKLS